jgi:hypothetical protein
LLFRGEGGGDDIINFINFIDRVDKHETAGGKSATAIGSGSGHGA